MTNVRRAENRLQDVWQGIEGWRRGGLAERRGGIEEGWQREKGGSGEGKEGVN